MTRIDPYQTRARELCIADGIDPDSRIRVSPNDRGTPAWCTYREAARREHIAAEQKALTNDLPPQDERYCNALIRIVGSHDPGTIAQLQNCMRVGQTVAGVLCADGHLGYAQPVGGVIAYEEQISISGVGFDIACGNMAVRLDIRVGELFGRSRELAEAIAKNISFGVGRTNNERVEHELFDNDELWQHAGMLDYRNKARAQLGTVGSGNHYVDLLCDREGFVWIGVHFGSRGLGHTAATRYLKHAGGTDGMNVPPAVVSTLSELGDRYLAAMELAGQYAYAGREWVVERVRQIVGGNVTDSVHNHHNYAWAENHHGRSVWVVRKGATPAFPGQRGFVGGSMGDDCVILRGVESERSEQLLYSTVHGAGRLFGRKDAIRRFPRVEMDAWLRRRGVMLLGGGVDESPMAYRRLDDVLVEHADTIAIEHRLTPFVVVMAGEGEVDPFKD